MLGPPVAPFYFFGFPYSHRLQKKGYQLILTSLLENLECVYLTPGLESLLKGSSEQKVGPSTRVKSWLGASGSGKRGPAPSAGLSKLRSCAGSLAGAQVEADTRPLSLVWIWRGAVVGGPRGPRFAQFQVETKGKPTP